MLRATSHLNRAIRRLLAGVSLVAQVVLVAAPLVDVHGPVPPATPQLSGAMHGVATTLPAGDDGSPHDATRCPACIAHSIHASPVREAVTPIRDLEHRVATETGAARGTSVPAPTSHNSRAPPRFA